MAAPLLASGLSYPYRDRNDADDLARRLRAMFRDLGAAGRIGAAYLSERPHEARPDSLVGGILDAAGYSTGWDDRELRKALLAAVRRDFSSGATLSLDGWLLSLTEARLCALVALNRS